jgi:hypothetical protein
LEKGKITFFLGFSRLSARLFRARYSQKRAELKHNGFFKKARKFKIIEAKSVKISFAPQHFAPRAPLGK